MFLGVGDVYPGGPGDDARGDDAPLDAAYELAPGYAGTLETVEAMRALARDGSRDPRVVALARSIAVSAPSRDHVAVAAALLRWVQQNVHYVRDPLDVELIQHPATTLLSSRAEDCDGLTVALAALAGAVGIPYAFRVVGTNPLEPATFEHVYAILHVGGQWVPADPMFDHPLGWEPPQRPAGASPTTDLPNHVAWTRDFPG